MPNLDDKEVKESLKKNEENLTLRFNTCLILLKDIEHVVKNATNISKNVFLLQKLSDFVVSASDKEHDDNELEKDEEIDVEEVTHFDNVNDEKEEQGQEATEEYVHDIEETNLVKIIAEVIASLPHSPRKSLKTSSLEKASVGLIVTNIVGTSTQSIFAPIQLNTTLTEVKKNSSIKQPSLPSTSTFVTVGTSTINILVISVVSTFLANPATSTIVYIPSMQLISSKIVETKPELSTRFLGKGKEKEEDIDLDEEIVFPNCHISNLNPDQMHIFGEILQKKAKQQRLREEKKKEFQIIKDAKNILPEALNIEVDTSQISLNWLAEVLQKFNNDLNGQEKLLQRVEKKFENKILELIAQKISIHQVELSTILGSLETSCNNVSLLFDKLCDISIFTKEIKDKLLKIDEDLKASAQQLQLDPS